MMKQPTILLVEDDRNDEELTRLALIENRVSNDLNIVRDGAEALDYLFGRGKFADRTAHPFPQVVLLDLKLPKVNGVEVLKQLRDHPSTKFLPVVVFTSSKEERDLVDCYKFGANAYVRKPINFSEFSEAVRQLGMFWVLLNQTSPQIGTPT